MIVRDEESNLDRCLRAAKPYVDEMCIVDSGSIDGTVGIAKAHGAKVQKIDWPNDFAEARNVSLEMATGDWILVLDADEVLRSGAEQEFGAIVDDPDIIAGFQNVTNHGDEGKQVSCLIMRLFRNMPDHRFVGAIHEQVITPILDNGARMNMRVVGRILDIDHYGYTESARQEKNKDERNRVHFEHGLEKEPENAYLWFKYGDFLRRFDDMSAVLTALKNAVDIVARMPDAEVVTLTYAAEPHALLALELIKLGRVEEAHATMVAARKRTRVTPMLHWVWGHINLKSQNWQEAKDAFEACHALDNQSVHVPAQPGITSGRSVFGIARALLGMGQKEEALALFESGAKSWPDCGDLQKAQARVLIARGEYKGAMEICMAFLKDDETDAEFWQIGAEMMMELGLWDQSHTWSGRAQACKCPENSGLCDGTAGELSFGMMALEVAADHWARSPDNPVCQAGLALIHVMVAEPIPSDIDLESPAIHYGFSCILRRLLRAPQGTGVAAQIGAGLEIRQITHGGVQGLLQRHMVGLLTPIA
ncbi:MAG: tetratricopeptide (TPR) repeat protein [Planctomycetota bacterium]|jgi:tetratricopeptide (TPR) repeat protein